MPHPAHSALPRQFSGLTIPETCPPGEGIVCLHCCVSAPCPLMMITHMNPSLEG
jgi:hypothetical protein